VGDAAAAVLEHRELQAGVRGGGDRLDQRVLRRIVRRGVGAVRQDAADGEDGDAVAGVSGKRVDLFGLRCGVGFGGVVGG